MDFAITVQSEKLIVLWRRSRSLFLRALGPRGPEQSQPWVQRFSGSTFSQPVSLGQKPNAQPTIRVGARRLAQYNVSELWGWKTSAPNLPNGGEFNPPRALTGRAPFSENRFMRPLWVNPMPVPGSGAQLIFQPSAWGVVRPVFHFQRSTSNCRAKATMTCLLRRT